MKKLILFVVTGSFLALSSAVRAEVPAVSKAPLAAMQQLTPLEGLWLMEPEVTLDGGKTWTGNPAERVQITFRQKGMLLAEIPLDPDQPGFHMESYISYDQYRKVFRIAAVDDVWGIMDLYEAQVIDGWLVGTDLKSGTLFPIDGGGWRGFRIRYELKSPIRLMQVEKTEDHGITWKPYFRIKYIKQ